MENIPLETEGQEDSKFSCDWEKTVNKLIT